MGSRPTSLRHWSPETLVSWERPLGYNSLPCQKDRLRRMTAPSGTGLETGSVRGERLGPCPGGFRRSGGGEGCVRGRRRRRRGEKVRGDFSDKGLILGVFDGERVRVHGRATTGLKRPYTFVSTTGSSPGTTAVTTPPSLLLRHDRASGTPPPTPGLPRLRRSVSGSRKESSEENRVGGGKVRLDRLHIDGDGEI